ncbi:MAG: hypothetical protein ACRD26_01985 [Vicinamibacterales bacterium]
MTDSRQSVDRWEHDLKNQLGIIVGFSELLLQDMDERQTRRSDFEAIRVAANRAMDLLALAPFPRDKRS